jgi:hypothetical protein
LQVAAAEAVTRVTHYTAGLAVGRPVKMVTRIIRVVAAVRKVLEAIPLYITTQQVVVL